MYVPATSMGGRGEQSNFGGGTPPQRTEAITLGRENEWEWGALAFTHPLLGDRMRG